MRPFFLAILATLVPTTAAAQWPVEPFIGKVEWIEFQGSEELADVDGDGDLDILSSTASDVVWIEVVNDEPGRLHVIESFGTPLAYGRVAWWDYDGDGDLDFAFERLGHWRWVENTGGGGIATSSTSILSLGNFVLIERFGDLDGDDDRDAVTWDTNGFYLQLRENLGGGSFTGPTTIASLGSVTMDDIRFVDIDTDGDLDIVTETSLMEWWVNDGAANFTGPNQLGSAPYGNSVFCDYDGDGDLDWVRRNQSTFAVEALPNDGTGVFFPATTVGGGGFDAALACGDLAGDPLPEIVENDGWSAIIYPNTAGVFGAGVVTPHSNFFRMAIGDLGADGTGEMVSAAEVTRVDSVAAGFVGLNGHYFTEIDSYATALAFGELDGEPGLDAMLDAEDVLLLHGGSNGHFNRWTQVDAFVSPFRSSQIGDIDQNGFNDVLGNCFPYLSYDPCWRLADGAGGFLPIEYHTVYGYQPNYVDIDGDTDLDLLVWSGPDSLLLLENTGGGVLAPGVTVLTLPDAYDEMRTVDIDADGDLDLVLGIDSPQQDLVWAENLGTTFAAQVLIEDLVDDVEVADIDGDGLLDLIYVRLGELKWAAGQVGAAPAAPQTLFAVGCDDILPMEVNGDGIADLACESTGLEVYPGTGVGPIFFGPPDIVAGTVSTSLDLIAQDVDGDGDEDLLALADDTVWWYRNETPLPDLDGDGSPASLDCDDSDPAIYPGATEVCDGIDNNCDAQIDEGLLDLDLDGVCDALDPCPLAPFDDSDGDGVCDDIDLCEGDDAAGDADFDGYCEDGTDTCEGDDASGDSDGDGFCATDIFGAPVDCDDLEPEAWPGHAEDCDGFDNDCDGVVDEGCETGTATGAGPGSGTGTATGAGTGSATGATGTGTGADTGEPTKGCDGCSTGGTGPGPALLFFGSAFMSLLRRRGE